MSYNLLFEQALQAFDQGSWNEAETLLRQIDNTAPDNPEVLNLLGLIAQAKGLHREACSYFAAALRQEDQKAAFHYNLAFSLKALKQYRESLLHFEKVLNLAPGVKETHNEMALIYEAMEQFEQANQHWQAALQLDKDYLEAEINMANALRHTDPTAAMQKLSVIAAKTPDAPEVWYDLAWLAYHKGDFATALSYIKRALELSQQSDDVYYVDGLILSALKQNKAAEAAFAKALELNANHAGALFSWANLQSKQANYVEAEKAYKRLIELSPDDFAVHNNYAEMLYRQRRLSEALEEYRQAVILEPKSAEVSNNLGAVLRDIKDYPQALDLFFNALSLNPQMTEISVNIAETLILFSAQEPKQALSLAEKWHKSYPDNPFAAHIEAALRGENVDHNQIYTEKLFDNFADNYELVMQNVAYSAPKIIRKITGPLVGRIADLGCGSGLMGLAVKDTSNRLIGVDLSAKMLEKAREKNIYDELIQADILDFLRQRQDFDWVLAADVLEYVGDLADFIKLCKNKKTAFSVEVTDEVETYQIQASGRFCHNPLYVEKLLQEFGFCAISKENLILRTENGLPVQGCVFVAS
jgi:predicted TPR repeat methyltransferase